MVLWVSPWCWAIWLLFQDLSLGWRFVCLLIRCVYLRGCFGYCGKIRAPCILFSPITRKKGPHWQRFREMYAFRAEDGKIFVLCIRFGMQSGDFGYMARESCHGGPFYASRSLESYMGRRSCQRSALRGPLRSGGQNKGPCCVGRGHAHATCPFPASASLDTRRLKKAANLPFMENGRCDRGKCLARLRKSLR